MVDDAISMTDLERCIAMMIVWFSNAGDDAKKTKLIAAEVGALYPDLPLPIFMLAMRGAYKRLGEVVGFWHKKEGKV